MRRSHLPFMRLETAARVCLRLLGLALLPITAPAFAAEPAAPATANPSTPRTAADQEAIVSTIPMELTAEGSGTHAQFVVAPEVVGAAATGDLVYTITAEPLFGRVGLAGSGEDADFFKTKTSRLGYFAYRPNDGYTGDDSFAYAVRNETSGLVFRNTVVVHVKPAPPVVMQAFAVGANREQALNVRSVSLTTRPNTPVTQKLPNHEEFMTLTDRVRIADARIAYLLDEKAQPQHGTAGLDRATGQLTYAPNPGFIGEDRFKYYTIDASNPHLGLENTVTVTVEPIRTAKRIAVDRARSREVDLVFVINNSPSMAAHQSRLAANLTRFRQLFRERDLDYRIGVLTTDFVNADPDRRPGEQPFFKEVRSVELDAAGNPVPDRRGRPKPTTKRVASNGSLVTLPALPQPWITPQTPDRLFAELVKVGTNGDSNRTAFTSVYNFVAGSYHREHVFLRPEATTIVVFFMDEEETRLATWKEQRDGSRQAVWIENGRLPDLLKHYNARHPATRQTLDGYINQWVLRPFIIAKGNKRGKIEMHAVVSPNNVSHRRAAELTGGTVLNIDGDFSGPLAALGDRIADTVAVALEPVEGGATFAQKSLRVSVDDQEVPADPQNGGVYDGLTHSIRFQGAAKKQAFLAKIDITYEEHR